MSEIKLSAQQIACMRHCARKSYFATSPTDDWEEIVSFGLAYRTEDPFCKGSKVYRLSQSGYEFLEKIGGQS